MIRLLLSTAVLLSASFAVAAEPSVKITQKTDTLDVSVGGKPFTVFNFGQSLPKPFFSPVLTPEGHVMTRALENPKDHPHHKGIWLSVDEVNDVRFWAERGKIQNISLNIVAAEGNPAKFQVLNHWVGKDGKPVVSEETTISIFANRLIAYDIKFTAGAESVTWGDTKEGLFGFRMVDSMREKGGDGKVENAEGLKGTAECWGKPSAWVDYVGTVEGEKVGVAIFDHPENFRPSRYHVRDYGLFSISPFGESSYTNGKEKEALVVLPKGKSLRLRYAAYIHPGETVPTDITRVHDNWVTSAADPKAQSAAPTAAPLADGEWIVSEIEEDPRGILSRIRSRIARLRNR